MYIFSGKEKKKDNLEYFICLKIRSQSFLEFNSNSVQHIKTGLDHLNDKITIQYLQILRLVIPSLYKPQFLPFPAFVSFLGRWQMHSLQHDLTSLQYLHQLIKTHGTSIYTQYTFYQRYIPYDIFYGSYPQGGGREVKRGELKKRIGYKDQVIHFYTYYILYIYNFLYCLPFSLLYFFQHEYLSFELYSEKNTE